MSRAIPVICRQVLFGRSRAISSARDVEQWFAQQITFPEMTCIGGLVMLDNERWLCLIEGPGDAVTHLVKDIESQLKPRVLQVLMTDRRARTRLFGHQHLVLRHHCTPLEMAAFLADIRHHGGKGQLWHIDTDTCLRLLDESA